MLRPTVPAILFAFVFGGLSIFVLLRLPPAVAILWSLALGAAFLWWHLRRNDGWVERRELIRIRRPTGAPTRIVTACACTLLLASGISGLVELFAPRTTTADLEGWERILAYQSSPGGWIALTCLSALVIPVVEEFCFRGYVQHTLERRYAPWLAIGITSVLFAAGHIGVPHWSILLIPLTLALGMGAAVHLFGSVWVAVGVHGTWNAAMAVSGVIHSDPTSTFGTMERSTLLPLSVALLGMGLVGWYLVLQGGERRAVDPVRNAM